MPENLRSRLETAAQLGTVLGGIASVAGAFVAWWIGVPTVELARRSLQVSQELEAARQRRESLPFVMITLLTQEVPIKREPGTDRPIIGLEQGSLTGIRNVGKGTAFNCRALWEISSVSRKDGPSENVVVSEKEWSTRPFVIQAGESASLYALPTVIEDVNDVRSVQGQIILKCDDEHGDTHESRQSFQLFFADPDARSKALIVFETLNLRP
ncbi:hypothetical protein [Caulifigura coniformis]|nr:hypothetical protein [Caulifigura coniformis]